VDNILDVVKQYGDKKFKNVPFLEWCSDNIIIVNKGVLQNFSLAQHEDLLDIYELPDVPKETHQKAAQKGVSTYALLKTLYRLDRMALKAGYYFPTDVDVADFAQDKCNPIIDHSEYLSSKMSYDKADNLGLKQIGNSSLYFRGVWTKRKVKSIDLDIIIKDEVDEADQENLVFAEDRLLHSSFKWIMELSQPSKPDFGINRSYKKSDQRYRLFKCKKCGRWNNVVDSFPGNLLHRGKDENLTAWIGCTRCKAKLDMDIGSWVAKYPTRSKDHVGFLHSQLWSKTISVADIYKKFINAYLSSEKKNLYISIVGIPYKDSDMCPFSDALLTDCEGKGGFEKEAYSSFMGIDVGDKCHVSIFGWTGKGMRLIHCEEVVASDEDRFCYLIENYRSFFVIDAMPYKTLAKKLCRKYKGWGAIQYFKGDSLKEGFEGDGDEEVMKVTHDRTESIDEMAGLFKEGFFELPNPKKLRESEIAVYEKFKVHMKNLEKEKLLDKKGYEKTEYKKNTANHFGMSVNSAFIAFRVGRGVYSPAVPPVFG